VRGLSFATKLKVQGSELNARASLLTVELRFTFWRRVWAVLEAKKSQTSPLSVVTIDSLWSSSIEPSAASWTLERLRAWGSGLRRYSEPWLDTPSPFDEAFDYIKAAYAQLEGGILTGTHLANQLRRSQPRSGLRGFWA
jgi:hypothetical protein